MRIKHFSGYGTVNAIKIEKKVVNKTTLYVENLLKVKVTGNHERGLTRSFDDPYLIYNWIVKRFERKPVDFLTVEYSVINNQYETIDGIETETAVYIIRYTTHY